MKLKIFSVLFLTMTISCMQEEEQAFMPPAQSGVEGKAITGTVTDLSGEPVAGIVVTDGFAHSVTDADGKYVIDSPYPQRVHFVSACFTSAYEPLLEGGRPVFYTSVPAYEGVERCADIKLKKKDAVSDDFTLLMIADPQARLFDSSEIRENFAYASRDVCEDLFADLRNTVSSLTGPVYGMCLGDVTYGSETFYSQYSIGLESVGVPFYNVIGNHDHFHRRSDIDDECVLPWEAAFGPRNCSFEMGEFHCVMLDNCIVDKAREDYPFVYGFEDEFIEWLAQDLSYLAKDTPLMIFTHANVLTENGAVTGDDYYNVDKFLELIKDFDNVYVWMGHLHINKFHGKVSGTKGVEAFVLARATGIIEGNEYLNPDGTPRGYLILNAVGRNLSWKYHSTQVEQAPFRGPEAPEFKLKSLDSDPQLRAWSRGDYGDDYVYANIYAWDNQWGTPVLRVGEQSYPMYRDCIYDLSYKEMVSFYRSKGIDSSLMQEYAVPRNRTHHFMVRVPGSASGTGVVEVVDRFGNTWQQEVQLSPKISDGGLEYRNIDFRTSPEGRLVISGQGSVYTLPGISGYRLVEVAVHGAGNAGKSQTAGIVDLGGNPVEGGDDLVFAGNTGDRWILPKCDDGVAYNIISRSNKFQMEELYLTYQRIIYVGGGADMEDMTVDDESDIEF